MASKNGPKFLFRPEQVASLAEATLLISSANPIYAVNIDSRKSMASSLFVPLRGERFDGHSFIEEALKKGAVAFWAEEAYFFKEKEKLFELAQKYRASFLLVKNSLQALQKLAKAYLANFKNLLRIGITGSSGKTTTKELLGAILESCQPTFISEGNLNSEIGVPVAAFKLRADHQYAVFEMGIDHPGEMDILAEIVKPQVAIITNIGTAHLMAFGTSEKIALEKRKIANYLKPDGALFLYEEEPFYNLLTSGIKANIIKYGFKNTPGLLGIKDLGLDGFAINWEGFQIHFPLVGHHNLLNLCAGLSLAKYLALESCKVAQALEKMAGVAGRLEISQGKITIIKDFYNANPDSMRKALNFLREVNWSGRKIAVLGSMKELGEQSSLLHSELGEYIADLDLSLIFFFGEETEVAYQAVLEKNTKSKAFFFTNFKLLEDELDRQLKENDLVLLKASRAMALERLMPMLEKKQERSN